MTTQTSYSYGTKGAIIGIVSNLLLFIPKILAGIFGNSQAMIADAFHTASDFATSVAVLIGFKIAKKPPDKEHPFGHGRAESICAKIVALVLIAISVKIGIDSITILFSGNIREPGMVALWAAGLSIIVKEITYRQVISLSNKIKSASLKADAFHHRSDAFSSVGTLIGIGGARMGFRFMDPLAGIFVAALILKIGIEVFHTAFDELMDAAPPDELKNSINDVVMSCEGVKEVRKIMVRKYGIEFFIEITIGVDGYKSVRDGHIVTMKIRRDMFKKIPGVKDTIVHVEPV